MSALVEHWFAACLIIATAGFWACAAGYAWRGDSERREQPPHRAIVPDIIVLDEDRGVRINTTCMDRGQVAETAYRLGLAHGDWDVASGIRSRP